MKVYKKLFISIVAGVDKITGVRIPLRRAFPLAGIVLLLMSSCSAYQYVSVESNLPRDEKQNFVFENDTVALAYTFAGQGFPIKISIFNKLPQPVYVDLARSIIVMNGQQLNGKFTDTGLLGFIAPQSVITIESIPLRSSFFNISQQDSIKINFEEGHRMEAHIFNKESTPMNFRCILAIATNEYYDLPTFYDFPFWVSDIVETTVNQSVQVEKTPNRFYLKRATGAGKFLQGVAIGILVVAGLLLSPA